LCARTSRCILCLVGVADRVRKAAGHFLERGPACLPVLFASQAEIGDERSDVHGTGSTHPATLGRSTHTARNLRQSELVVVERLDHPEQSFRVPRCDRDHLLSLPQEVCRESNGTAPKER